MSSHTSQYERVKSPDDTVTITISRKAAEDFISARYGEDSLIYAEGEISGAIKAALKETE